MATPEERTRDLVQEAWAYWHEPISKRLARTAPELVLAELDRRRTRADRIHRDEHEAIERLEARWRAAAGYPSRRPRDLHDGSARARARAELDRFPQQTTVSLPKALVEELLG